MLNLLLKIYFSLSVLIIGLNCGCSMMQNCKKEEEDLPSCQPSGATGDFKKTRKFDVEPEDNLCPDYKKGDDVCCSSLQIRKIKTNFIAIESIFGSATGGCDICVTNLKRFWCHFTCAPNQDTFLDEEGIHDHKIGNKTIPLLDLKFHLNENMNCELFKSCMKTKFAAQVPAMGNAVGFTTFQGVNAYTKIAVYITIMIDKEKGLTYPIDTCDTKAVNGMVRGYKIEKECTCNSCSLKCNYELGSTTPILEGLNWLIVGLFYLFVIISTVIIFFVKQWYEKNNKFKRIGDIEQSENAISGFSESKPLNISNE